MSKWTAPRDQKLFLLYIKHVRVDHKAIAAEWKKEYGKWLRAYSFSACS